MYYVHLLLVYYICLLLRIHNRSLFDDSGRWKVPRLRMRFLQEELGLMGAYHGRSYEKG